MRAGLSTIQQTLTPEAANVLNHSIAEAGRRNHGQTTPLHVAATLLASPTGFLRQACIRSHPNSSHPLQCRALELCFSVALERLPTSTSSPAVTEPPISNALMAALKRAQAHQRRGCPEQQQQPLLAVKVELEQLIISILDDPSVSRVMREASFSSPAVKATIEQALNNTNSSGSNHLNPSGLGIGFRPSLSPTTAPGSIPINRNLYLNPRLQPQEQGNQQRNDESTVSSSAPRNLYLNPKIQQQGSLSLNQPVQQRSDDVKKVIDIMLKSKKRNPILVGESEPEAVRKEILKKIENGELVADGELKNAEVISIEKELVSLSDKSQIPAKIKELGDLIQTRIGISENSNATGKGIIVDLADLKWLVEQPPTTVAPDIGRESVAEMGKLVAKFGAAAGRIWLIGTATCETYLRCQVYHPAMETSWDLQAVPIASRSPMPTMFPRMATNGILGNSVESLNPLKNFQSMATAMPRRLSENLDPARRPSCCPQCSGEYEQELAKLNQEFEKSSVEAKSTLPLWLRTAKAQSGEDKTTDQSKVKDQELVLKQRTQELQKKWSDTCLRLHPNHHQNQRLERIVPAVVPIPGMYKPNMLLRPTAAAQPPRLQPARTLGEALQLKPDQETGRQPVLEQPRSPVRTDLALGPKKLTETAPPPSEDLTVKDLLGCISSEPQEFQKGKFANAADADSFKKLLKGLMRKAWWQPEAASAIATTVTESKVDSGSRGCVWLVFAGPDRVAKKKMASVIAEHVCGANPITICLGLRRDEEEVDMGFRGKTALDRIVEAVRRNPHSVIILSDVDEADTLIRGSIKRAMERGRLTDSHGREISLGNVIFILTGNWSTANLNEHLVDERRLRSIASSEWQLRLTIGEKRLKRRANWLLDKERSTRPRKEQGCGLSLDLNLAVDVDTDGSLNSSDLTFEQEDVLALENRQFAVTSVPSELVGPSDGTVVFKPVHFGLICREIEKTVRNAFSTIVDDKIPIEVDEAALENVLGGMWFGQTGLEEWAEQVLVPSFHQLKTSLPFSGEDLVVRLESDRAEVQVGDADGRDWLPSRITVMVDGM